MIKFITDITTKISNICSYDIILSHKVWTKKTQVEYDLVELFLQQMLLPADEHPQTLHDHSDGQDTI